MAKTPVTWTEQDFSIKVGNTFTLPITWADEDGTPVDFTGYTFEFSYRAGPGAPDTVLTGIPGITVVGNTTTIKIASTTTADFTCDLPYEFSYILAGEKTTVLVGTLKLSTKYGG